MHFNLDNKEYSLTLKMERRKQKAKERTALCSASNRSFAIKFSCRLADDELIKTLSKYTIDRILVEDAELEDIFLHYYE